MVAKKGITHTVGSRKRAVARAFIEDGSGKIIVNGKPFEEYFGRATLRMIVKQPLEVTGTESSYDVRINVRGGGLAGQAGATRHSIGRALLSIDEKYRSMLRQHGLLTRDAREVERKKYGRHKARKRPQFSKR